MSRLARVAGGIGKFSQAELEARDRALHAVAIMRRDRVSLRSASKQAATDPRTVHRYAPSALKKSGSRWQPTASDRIQRRQWTVIIGDDARPVAALVETRSSRQASVIGEHTSDIGIVVSVRTAPEARAAAAARLEARHGLRAGLRAYLNDGTEIADPRFFGLPPDLVDAYDEIGLGDLDYGSSAAIGAKR